MPERNPENYEDILRFNRSPENLPFETQPEDDDVYIEEPDTDDKQEEKDTP